MNAQRAEAYLKVIGLLDTESGVTLRPDEVAAIRHAADVLLFDEEGRADSVAAAREAIDKAIESERWSEERGERLFADVEACGALVEA